MKNSSGLPGTYIDGVDQAERHQRTPEKNTEEERFPDNLGICHHKFPLESRIHLELFIGVGILQPFGSTLDWEIAAFCCMSCYQKRQMAEPKWMLQLQFFFFDL